jgi:CubicO group peptidase (beta-lactamase class C family)
MSDERSYRQGVGSVLCSAIVLVPVLAAVLSGCSAPSGADPVSLSMRDSLQVLADKHHVCGAAVAIVRDRKLASLESASGCRPTSAPTAGSVFQAASLSKPVFAYAVQKLAAQGKLELDAPVLRYLPQGYRHRANPLHAQPSELVTDPRLGAITVRMVLNHTSGLPNWTSGPLQVETPPGTEWQYSGEGYVLLQRAVEQVTAQPLDRAVDSLLFEPLGMNSSAYVLNERLSQSILPGTKANGAPRTLIATTEAIAAFSLHTTAADYGKFLAAVLNDEAGLAQITTSPVSVDPGLGLAWGLGWGIEQTRGDTYIWQWGNNPGYRAFVIASVRTGDGMVLLTNGENGLKLAEPVTQKILPDDHKLFQSSILGTDLLSVLCNTVRLCL